MLIGDENDSESDQNDISDLKANEDNGLMKSSEESQELATKLEDKGKRWNYAKFQELVCEVLKFTKFNCRRVKNSRLKKFCYSLKKNSYCGVQTTQRKFYGIGDFVPYIHPATSFKLKPGQYFGFFKDLKPNEDNGLMISSEGGQELASKEADNGKNSAKFQELVCEVLKITKFNCSRVKNSKLKKFCYTKNKFCGV